LSICRCLSTSCLSREQRFEAAHPSLFDWTYQVWDKRDCWVTQIFSGQLLIRAVLVELTFGLALYQRKIYWRRRVILLIIPSRSPKWRTTSPIIKKISKIITRKSSSRNPVPRETGQRFFSVRTRLPQTQTFEQKYPPNQLSTSLSHDTSTPMIQLSIFYIPLPFTNSFKPIGKTRIRHR
jgi:hypothetical protein